MHPKIPFLATEFRMATDQPALGSRVYSSCELRAASDLLWIQSEGFELSAPFRGSVAESLDTKAAGQTTFDRGFDEVRREERDRHCRAGFLRTGTIQQLPRLMVEVPEAIG